MELPTRPPRTTRRPKTRLSVFLPRQTEALSSRVVLRPEPEMSVVSSCAARRGVDWLFVRLRQRLGCCCPTLCASAPHRAPPFFFFPDDQHQQTHTPRYRLIMLGPPQSAAASISPGSWVLARGLSLISLPCLPCDRPGTKFFSAFSPRVFPGRAFHDVKNRVLRYIYLPRLTFTSGFLSLADECLRDTAVAGSLVCVAAERKVVVIGGVMRVLAKKSRASM